MRIPEEVSKSYADSLAGCSAEEAEELQAEWRYVTLLYEHNWEYSNAEHSSIWFDGLASLAALVDMRRGLDPLGKLWNAHCPPNHQVHITTGETA